MSDGLRYEYGDKTFLELMQLQEGGHLNLEAGFQRNSVWRPSDRRTLIQSILQGYPIPSIFLYKREEDGMPVYDVIDGKQRLETVFLFTRTAGYRRGAFDVHFHFDGDDDGRDYDWRLLEKLTRKSRILTYKVQTVEVSGDLAEIIDLFVRINSTGKALTASERRHARYYHSPVLREAERLARKLRPDFLSQQILRAGQVGRMKDVELTSELLASVINGGLIHKKAAVDRAVGNESLHGATLKKAIAEVQATATTVRRMFPDLRSTRVRNVSEVYSLFMTVWDLRNAHLVMNDRKRNRVAHALLVGCSNHVDRVRTKQIKINRLQRGEELYASYLISTQQATDNLVQRKQRAQILRGLPSGLFERRDAKRLFSSEQRRLLWNSEEKRICRECRQSLDWTNFQVDHITPHSLGGATELVNAALVCASCNRSKGARRAARVRRHRRRRRAA